MRTHNKVNSYKKEYESESFWGVVMSSKNSEILEFNQYLKSDKMPHIIYADVGSSIKRIDECKIDPGKSSASKTGQNIQCLWYEHLMV